MRFNKYPIISMKSVLLFPPNPKADKLNILKILAHRTWAFQVVVIILSLAITILSVKISCAEHEVRTISNVFNFTGTTGDLGNDMQEFTIPEDGAVYFTLKSFTPSDALRYDVVLAAGFMRLGPGCSARYISTIRGPFVGQTYGPFYMKADSYVSYFYLNGGAGTEYALEIDYRPQLIPNDQEENDAAADSYAAEDASPGSTITGHVGYLGCEHDKKDFASFGVTQPGEYDLTLELDDAFFEINSCDIFVYLYDKTERKLKAKWTGPGSTKTTFIETVALDKNNDYQLSIEAKRCYETIFEGGGSFVTNNKAGGYTFEFVQNEVTVKEFAIADLSIKPSVLWPGESFNGKVLVQNNATASTVKLSLQIVRLRDNSVVTTKDYLFSVSPNCLNLNELSLGEVMGNTPILSLEGGNYILRATASSTGVTSSADVSFSVNEGGRNVVPIINFLIQLKE